MRTPRRALAIAAVSATILLVTSVGTAHAGDFDVVAGREKVKVTMASAYPYRCVFYVDGTSVGDIVVETSGPRSRVFPAAAGVRSIESWCHLYPVGIWELGSTIKTVTVEPANPALDLVDGILGGVGLGALATDPTIRP